MDARHSFQFSDAAEARLKFLADASQQLASSLDYETTLDNVAHLAVPGCADWCAVDIFEEDDGIRRLSVVHMDEAKVALAFELFEKYPPSPQDAHGLTLVRRTGAPQFYDSIPDELLTSVAHDPEHLAILRNLGMRSAIIMPMKAHGKTLGAITFVFAESGRHYQARDLEFVFDLASRAALAIENARLFREASQAAERERRSAAILDTLLMSAPISFAFMDKDLRYRRVNEAFERMSGISREQLLGRRFGESYSSDVRRLGIDLDQVLATKKPLLNLQLSGSAPGSPGDVRHSVASYYPVVSGEEVIGVGALIYDVTEQKELEQKLRNQVYINEKLRDVGTVLTGELNLDKIVQAVTDVATELSGAQFGAFFYNVLRDDGEAYTLYSVSGVPREKFSSFPMPRKTQIFGPTFDGTGIVRLDDVTQDPRFGRNEPYRGMPAGHLPVRSYLAVPVISRSGEVLGGLFFGHEKPGVFTDAAERIVAGLAPQAAIAVDNARLFDAAHASRAQLQTQLNFTAALTSSLGEGVCALDREGRVTFVNPAAVELLGGSREALIGKSVAEVFPMRDEGKRSPAILFNWNHVIAEKTLIQGEGALACRDGRTFPVSFLATPFMEQQGVQGVVVTFRDITEARRIQDELQRSHEELERRVVERTVKLTAANQELEAFSYSVSHDLRSPLRSIDGFSQALLEDYGEQLDRGGQDSLHRIRSASQKMGRIIDDLLNLAKLSRTEMRREPVDLSEMAGKIAQELRSAEPDRRVEVRIEPGARAHGDGSLLRIALENLLSNAWKFTGRKEDASIEFGVRTIAGETVYFVQDNGAGFNMEYADKLFGAFQRLHQAHEFSGTGIGLATVRRIIHRHGGRVWAESRLDQGATFSFTIPH